MELNMQFAHMFMDQNNNSIEQIKNESAKANATLSSSPVSNVFCAEVHCMDTNHDPFHCATSAESHTSQSQIGNSVPASGESRAALVTFTLHFPPTKGVY